MLINVNVDVNTFGSMIIFCAQLCMKRFYNIRAAKVLTPIFLVFFFKSSTYFTEWIPIDSQGGGGGGLPVSVSFRKPIATRDFPGGGGGGGRRVCPSGSMHGTSRPTYLSSKNVSSSDVLAVSQELLLLVPLKANKEESSSTILLTRSSKPVKKKNNIFTDL